MKLKDEEEDDHDDQTDARPRKKRTFSLSSISSRVAKLESSQKLYLIGTEQSSGGTEINTQGPAKGNTEAEDGAGNETKPIVISDIIGNFGSFQLLVLIFSGLRDFSDSYDALMMSMIFRPETDFYCAENNTTDTNSRTSNLSETSELLQCFRSHPNGSLMLDARSGQLVACRAWNFTRTREDQDEASLVVEWSLVCQRHWLVAPIQSCFFLGLVVGNLVWGYAADRYGRRRTYLLGHLIQVLFGLASIFLSDVALYTLCRFFTAFGSASHNILYSVQVEMIGAKYRPYCTALNHFGWGVGIMSTPFIARASADYRYVIGVSPIVTLIMMPFALLLPESSRWLTMNGLAERARDELLRVAKFNGLPITPLLIDKIRQLNEQTNNLKQSKKTLHSPPNKQPSSYQIIMQDRTLLRDTLILCYSILLGYLFYYVLTLNFGYIENLSVEANFITSGAGEWLSVIGGAIMLKFFTRKTSMCLIFNLMAVSFAVQFLVDSSILASLDTRLFITLNNAIGKASTLLLVFVLLIVNQEIYPTLVRQTGSSFVNTVAEIGATLAPIVIQVSRVYGMWRADLVSAGACFAGSFLVLFLSKTDDKELV